MLPTQSDYSVYRDVINQLMSGNEQLPSLPSITFEIRRALEQPDISFSSLSKLIAKDPSLSALLLKYASNCLLTTTKFVGRRTCFGNESSRAHNHGAFYKKSFHYPFITT